MDVISYVKPGDIFCIIIWKFKQAYKLRKTEINKV